MAERDNSLPMVVSRCVAFFELVEHVQHRGFVVLGGVAVAELIFFVFESEHPDPCVGASLRQLFEFSLRFSCTSVTLG